MLYIKCKYKNNKINVYSMKMIGIDSKRFVNGKFHALLGVAVTVSDFEKFKNTYNSILSKLFEELNIERKKKIYKAYEIKRLFLNTGIDALETFFKGIEPNVDFLNILYSYFKDKENPRGEDSKPFIKIYYKEPTKEMVTAIQFIDQIEHSYPYICGWDIVKKNPLMEFSILTDHFETKPSKAWNEFSSIKNVGIIHSGGQCNYLISAADIILAALENRILNNGVYLNRSIHGVIEEYRGKFETSFLGSGYLYSLSPSHKWIANNLRFLKHPIFYIFKEGRPFKELFKDVSEEKYLEQSLLLNKIYDLACEYNGSVKYYDPSKDNLLIQNNDIFVYYGEQGFTKIKMLQSLGYNNVVKDAHQILNSNSI